MDVLDSIVIGAGQGGLAASYFLTQRGIDHVLLDANPIAGGAWQHRWDSLTMRDVHGVADLPGESAPPRSDRRANEVVPAYFAAYEKRHALPVVRPVTVDAVTSDADLLVVHAGPRRWTTRTLINATGTWTRPNWPHYPGIESFAGEQFHTVTYPGREHLRGKRVLVVGGGASAVQFIGELAPIADVRWVTRRTPHWRESGTLDAESGLQVVTQVERRVVAGLPPTSVVSATGLILRPQEAQAAALGAYDHPLPIFTSLEPGGARWPDGSFEPADVILWATGFRSATDHLGPLGLRGPQGGIPLQRVPGNVQAATTAVRDPRVHLIGYGPSASTIGASRAARRAALEVARQVQQTGHAANDTPRSASLT